MKVVAVGGKVYEIDGLPHGGTLPMWQLLRQNGQPMMPEMLDQLSDAEKRELDAKVQEYIRETAAYQAEVAARSAALARGEKLPDEGSGLLEPAQSFSPAPPTSATPPVAGEAAISAAYNTSPYNTAAYNGSPDPLLAEPSGPSRPPSPGPGTLRPHGPAEPPAPQPSDLGFGEAGDRDGFNQGPFQPSTVVSAPPTGVAFRDPNDRTGEVPSEALTTTTHIAPAAAAAAGGAVPFVSADRLFEEELREADRRRAEFAGQRPATYRFTLRGGRIDVLPEPPEPENREFALDTYNELVVKARELRERLKGTNSTRRVCNSIERLLAALGTRFDDLRPGVLLSRTRSIEADRAAFSDELLPEPLAMMDDTLQSLRDLLAAFPVVRRIEAERLALDLDRNGDAVPIIRRQMDAIKVAAEKSGATTEATISALAQNDAAIADATDLVERTGLVADNLLVFGNFVRVLVGGIASYRAAYSPRAGRSWLRLAGIFGRQSGSVFPQASSGQRRLRHRLL
jgi:hypothetical protein